MFSLKNLARKELIIQLAINSPSMSEFYKGLYCNKILKLNQGSFTF